MATIQEQWDGAARDYSADLTRRHGQREDERREKRVRALSLAAAAAVRLVQSMKNHLQKFFFCDTRERTLRACFCRHLLLTHHVRPSLVVHCGGCNARRVCEETRQRVSDLAARATLFYDSVCSMRRQRSEYKNVTPLFRTCMLWAVNSWLELGGLEPKSQSCQAKLVMMRERELVVVGQ